MCDSTSHPHDGCCCPFPATAPASRAPPPPLTTNSKPSDPRTTRAPLPFPRKSPKKPHRPSSIIQISVDDRDAESCPCPSPDTCTSIPTLRDAETVRAATAHPNSRVQGSSPLKSEHLALRPHFFRFLNTKRPQIRAIQSIVLPLRLPSSLLTSQHTKTSSAVKRARTIFPLPSSPQIPEMVLVECILFVVTVGAHDERPSPEEEEEGTTNAMERAVKFWEESRWQIVVFTHTDALKLKIRPSNTHQIIPHACALPSSIPALHPRPPSPRGSQYGMHLGSHRRPDRSPRVCAFFADRFKHAPTEADEIRKYRLITQSSHVAHEYTHFSFPSVELVPFTSHACSTRKTISRAS
ncbi:hypothetical protein EW146_g2763 [Bondarzewia mesenterica]|uniref:Uncharacterized protein n=1 Tax=Bondarzewia mesenterica TaxID=1095465 RepID=A0A4S4LZN4_9AGAM|nr:hypothetical protein EW146_g2763 [Bondarzewia mesenterica]